MIIYIVTKPWIIILLTLVILVITGILTPLEALSGFSNNGVLTILLLYIVVSPLKKADFSNYLHQLLGTKSTSKNSLLRMMISTSLISAFINNTPIVLMLLVPIKKWCHERGILSSKFLIPLSYASIFGGTITLIGTSINLITNGMMLKKGINGLTMFELTKIGLPSTILGITYLYYFGFNVLPNNDIDSVTTETHDIQKINKSKLIFIISAFIGMIFLSSFSILSLFQAALIVVVVLFITRTILISEAIGFIDFHVLFMVGAMFGIGVAIEKTALSSLISAYLGKTFEHFGILGIVFVIYIFSNLIAELISHIATIVIMFPIILDLSQQIGIEPRPLILVLTIAASATFCNPISYQTNLIVYSTGLYRFTDYFKVGFPLNLIFMLTTILIVPNSYLLF